MQKRRANFSSASLIRARSLVCGATTVSSACSRAASPGLTLIVAPPRMLMTSAALAGVQIDDFCVRMSQCVETWQGQSPIPGLAGPGSSGGRGALGWGLGDSGARGRGRRGPCCAWECLEFERKARAGPRRTLAGFLTGLWQYVFAGLGLLAALN